MSEPSQSAAIFFLPDGYDLSRARLMGRQVAGHGFLRAAVAARGEAPVVGYGPPTGAAEDFKTAVSAIDPGAATDWFSVTDAARRNAAGVCFRPDAALTGEARFRLRHGPGRYCLTGITHTLASAGTMAEIAGWLREPFMPWDAVICTSQAAAETIRRVHEASADYLRWRHGPEARLGGPQSPVIPLGVHTCDFQFDEAERLAARAALGLAEDEVAALFVGRLAFAAKAHPQAMYEGLQAAAERTGSRVALIECGQSPNAVLAEAYAKGAADFAPAVRRLAVDGRGLGAPRRCWAACDLFVSLSDNIQETFGLTPVEAMAAGLPVVVSDWNGYRDTVRDGVDGFRIRTWAPAAGFGDPLAEGAEVGALNYDLYNWGAASTTSLDPVELVDRLSALVADPDLRRRMGEAGRARARATFDWAHVYRQYQALWGELNARRLCAAANPDEMAWLATAPGVAPDKLDPFAVFGHYPTAAISAGTVARLSDGASLERYRALAGHVLWTGVRAPERFVAPLWARLERGPATVAEGAGAIGSDLVTAVFVVGTLAKMGLLMLEAPEA